MAGGALQKENKTKCIWRSVNVALCVGSHTVNEGCFFKVIGLFNVSSSAPVRLFADRRPTRVGEWGKIALQSLGWWSRVRTNR